MIKYTSYKNLRNLLRQLLSCKISYKIQLKNLKYLPPQSLACEVYRKQENEVKDLLQQPRRTRKINDKMQQRAVKKSFLAVTSAPNQRYHALKLSITSSAAVIHVRSLRSNVRLGYLRDRNAAAHSVASGIF